MCKPEMFKMSLFYQILILFWLLVFAHTAFASDPLYPFPVNMTYASGTIRPDHLSQSQLNDDVVTFYVQWKSDYLVNMGGNPAEYRISFGSSNPGRTVSEGQGYGMIITAIMAGYETDAQEIFDGLYNFVKAHPSCIDGRLMAWQVPEGSGGEDSAFDGDADIAYALLLADAQWGSDGSVDYLSEALTRITAIKESTIGPESFLPTLGDWVNYYGATYNQYTPRSSDFLPAHFRSFEIATADVTWGNVITAIQYSISSLQTNYSPATGLLPDFIQPVSPSDHTPRPADPGFLEGDYDGDYFYNAGRDPWRIAVDALLNDDPVSMNQARKIADWIAAATAENPGSIKAGYYLNGSPLPGSSYFTTFFAGPFGVATMTQPSRQQFLNDIYDSVRTTHEDYFEDSVNLLCLLVMTGNYWDPELMLEVVSDDFFNISSCPNPCNMFSYPNPFSSCTTISFSVPPELAGNVELNIYDLNGRRIKTLIKEILSAGEYSVVWNTEDNTGRNADSGIYFYELRMDNYYAETRKITLLNF